MAEAIAECPDHQLLGAGILERVQLGVVGPVAEAVPFRHRDPLIAMQQRADPHHDDQDFLLKNMAMPPRGAVSRRHGLDGEPDRLRPDRPPYIGHPGANITAEPILERCDGIDADVMQRHGMPSDIAGASIMRRQFLPVQRDEPGSARRSGGYEK